MGILELPRMVKSPETTWLWLAACIILLVSGWWLRPLPARIIGSEGSSSASLVESGQGREQPERMNNGDHEHDCDGKRIFMHDLPAAFNELLLPICTTAQALQSEECRNLMNHGFGPEVQFKAAGDPLRDLIVPSGAWFQTDQFSLELIFRFRLTQYRCLVEDPELADLFFVPYYPGKDIVRYIFTPKVHMRDRVVQRLVGWLEANPFWRRRQGRDHFLLLGRIVWDFTRQEESEDGWGSSMLNIPELRNATKLLLEKDVWREDQVAIPYPTAFHPRSMKDVWQWQAVVENSSRPYGVSFVGGSRGSDTEPIHIRTAVLKQCEESVNCTVFLCRRDVDCGPQSHHELIGQIYLKSVFCLQPPGDSPTRKAIFDSLIAGCIPVFVNPQSAYTQYTWHLPDGDEYSVLYSEGDILGPPGFNVLQALAAIPEEKVKRMRNNILHLLPQLVYASGTLREGAAGVQRPTTTMTTGESKEGPSGTSVDFKDAFDLILERLLQRVRTQDS